MIKQLIKFPFNAVGLDLIRRPNPQAQQKITFPPTQWLSRFNVRTIVDIGANEGDFAIAMSERFPEADILSFEPLAGTYSVLQQRLNHLSRCKTFNFALGDSNGQIEIRRNQYSPSSSILPITRLLQEAFPMAAQEVAMEQIEVKRLDDVLEHAPQLKSDIFVKIDVQGFEANVIRGATQTLRLASAAVVETSFSQLYEGQPLFDEIYQMMNALGFSYAGNWDQLVDNRDGRVLQADAIFLRGTRRC